MEDERRVTLQLEGVQWFAGLVNGYEDALDVSYDGDLRAVLVKDFQARLLSAILDPAFEVDGLMRIIAPAEFELFLRKRAEKRAT